MNVLSLFSGVAGFEIGLIRAGMTVVAQCEIDKYAQGILQMQWPDVPCYEDVRDVTRERLDADGVGAIDVICGGWPCQPFSVAGKQAGKEDDRHLWPEVHRLIQECRPKWVIGENVSGFVTMALDDTISDLESEGYTARAMVIPACAVNAIHRRDRVWIVAYAETQ